MFAYYQKDKYINFDESNTLTVDTSIPNSPVFLVKILWCNCKSCITLVNQTTTDSVQSSSSLFINAFSIL